MMNNKKKVVIKQLAMAAWTSVVDLHHMSKFKICSKYSSKP